jgi:uncharacterized protein involved in response to NO
VFLRFKMYCVGCPIACFHTVDDACREHGVNREAFLVLREARSLRIAKNHNVFAEGEEAHSFFVAHTGWLAAMLVDTSFLLLVASAASREILAGRNWRNMKVVILLLLLLAANTAFHLEAHLEGTADVSIRLAIAVIVLLIALIGGRLVPSFTRNWLVRENPGRLPAPFARWAGDRTTRERLLLILHVGYAFVPLGFLLNAAAALGQIPTSGGIHAWMAGAAGVMTLAVMSRATLGHTGRQLSASLVTQTIYAAVILAAISRICAALEPAHSMSLLHVSAFSWAAAFFGFALTFGPLLIGIRKRERSERKAAV